MRSVVADTSRASWRRSGDARLPEVPAQPLELHAHGRERLQVVVVHVERDPPPLVLLCGDHVGQEPAALTRGVLGVRLLRWSVATSCCSSTSALDSARS